MTPADLNYLRLYHQQVTVHNYATPEALVAYMGAFQAQEYAQSLWAVGMRLPGSRIEDVEQALANRSIIRSWPMRNTLHLAPAKDIHWMLELACPKTIGSMGSRRRQLELDDATMQRCMEVMQKAMQGKKELNREELRTLFLENGLDASGVKLSHIMLYAAVHRVVCYGVKKGTEQTYTLLHDWVTPAQLFDKPMALKMLAEKYFTSHGPATIADFCWWSGLNKGDAKKGLEAVTAPLESFEMDGETYWMKPPGSISLKTTSAFLMSGYEEYLLGYKDRSACLPEANFHKVVSNNGVFHPIVVVDGMVRGAWTKSVKKDAVFLEIKGFHAFSVGEKGALEEAAEGYGYFLGKKVGGVAFEFFEK